MFLSDVAPYSLAPAEKCEFLRNYLAELLEHHRDHCVEYSRLVSDWESHRAQQGWSISDYPFIPVTAFKEFDLRSTEGEVAQVQSSATTSGQSSKIYVDRATKKRQTISAAKILSDFVGAEKRPYLVFDVEETVRGMDAFSARGAAILSLAHLTTEFLFVMRKQPSGELVLDEAAFQAALQRIGRQPFLAYGFTYILYQAHQAISAGSLAQSAAKGSRLLHSGGWKRLEGLAVDKATFNAVVAAPWRLPPESVIDFYGTVEQVGVVYPDCPLGNKHVPYWADVIIRRPDTLAPAEPGETGLIQLINTLPLSAPNHSVLTEDLGSIVLEDGCGCGRRGRAFTFQGRAPKSEIRGCSDIARY